MATLNILYEDPHILICVKPHGIATQSKSIRYPDMVSLIKNHLAAEETPFPVKDLDGGAAAAAAQCTGQHQCCQKHGNALFHNLFSFYIRLRFLLQDYLTEVL